MSGGTLILGRKSVRAPHVHNRATAGAVYNAQGNTLARPYNVACICAGQPGCFVGSTSPKTTDALQRNNTITNQTTAHKTYTCQTLTFVIKQQSSGSIPSKRVTNCPKKASKQTFMNASPTSAHTPSERATRVEPRTPRAAEMRR